MTAKELIGCIFSKLDNAILNNSYFQELKKIVFDNCGNNFESISVNSGIYKQLPLTSFPVKADSGILKFRSGPVYLNLSNIDGILIVELRLEKDNVITSTTATITDFSRIDINSIGLKDGTYVSFNTEVYYYMNNEILPMTLLGDDDFNFANEFHIPFRLARYFRLNFKKFGAYFNKYKKTEDFTEIDSYLKEKDYYAFIGPFEIRFFVEFIKGYVFDNLDSSLLTILAEDGRFDDLLPERDIALKLIIQFIGSDGEGVITYALYQSLLLYLTGCVMNLNAKGFLIQKVNDLYTVYFISFVNNVLHVEAKGVTEEQAQLMYEQNEFNRDNKSLESFFNINLTR